MPDDQEASRTRGDWLAGHRPKEPEITRRVMYWNFGLEIWRPDGKLLLKISQEWPGSRGGNK